MPGHLPSPSPSEADTEEEKPQDQKNALYMLARGWGWDTDLKCWSCPTNDSKVSSNTVAKSDPNNLKNVVALLERGFSPGKGSVWFKDPISVDKKALKLPHEVFLKNLRKLQRDVWVKERGDGDD